MSHFSTARVRLFGFALGLTASLALKLAVQNSESKHDSSSASRASLDVKEPSGPAAAPAAPAVSAVRSDLARRIRAKEYLPLLTEDQDEAVSTSITDEELAILSLPKEDLVTLVLAWKAFANDPEFVEEQEGRMQRAAEENGVYSPAALREWAIANEPRIRGCLGAKAVFPGPISLSLEVRPYQTGYRDAINLVVTSIGGKWSDMLPNSSMWAGEILRSIGDAGAKDWVCIDNLLGSAVFLPPNAELDPSQRVNVYLEDQR